MSARITLICDQQVRDSSDGDLCGSRISAESATTLAQAREFAARHGWTVNETGDACSGCSGRWLRRPVLRTRLSGRWPRP